MTTDAQIDAAFESAMAEHCAKLDADLKRQGLDIVERLSRHGLLIALDWESGGKANTKRLRAKVRQAVLDGATSLPDLQNAWHIINSGLSGPRYG